MNSQNLKYAYEILDNIFEKNVVFSLGGYHSLVKQNILKEFRSINDIDVNIIIDNITKDSGLLQDQIVNYFHDFVTFGRISGKDYIIKLNTEPERDYYKKKAKQNEEPLRAESDVCFSISLTTESAQNYIAKYKVHYDSNNMFSSWSSPAEQVTDPSIRFSDTIQSTIDTSGLSFTTSNYYNAGDLFRWSNSNGINITPETNRIVLESQKNKDSRVFVSTGFDDFIKTQIFDKLVDLVLSSNNELTIDFFIMEHDPKHNQISVINEENYTSYYPILKAKHRYCTEKFTPEESFRKHIHDLSLSFNAKRIKGLNYPEDIELLIKNWEEMHEKDK